MKYVTIEDILEQPTGSPTCISLFPDFILGAMARRGPGVVESVDVDAVKAPPTRWNFQSAGLGAAETIAETRRIYFRTILARFGHFCGISLYGGEAELAVAAPFSGSLGTHYYSIVLCNSRQLGFKIRIGLQPSGISGSGR